MKSSGFSSEHNSYPITKLKLQEEVQDSEQLPQATMSRTSDERLDEIPTAEVQGLRGDISDSPSIREVSRSVRSSSRNRGPASNLEQSPAQVAAMLLRGSQLANQQGVSATTGDSVQMINTPLAKEAKANALWQDVRKSCEHRQG